MTLSFIDTDVSFSGSLSSYNFTGARAVESGANRYLFFIDGNDDIVYRKSTNRGKTWGAAVVIHASTYEWISVWFDQWTPGDSGTIVHIWGITASVDDVNYLSLDISSDTIGNTGTPIVVFNGVSVLGGGNGGISGAKSKGGNLLVVFDIDGGTEVGTYRSTDAGATWGVRADANEAASTDYYLLFPGNEADTQDMWLVFWDRSASAISLKTYDDSADSWAETSVATSMTAVLTTTVNAQFSGTMRASDSHLLLAAWSARDSATGDLLTWDINGAGSITAKGNIHTDTDDCHGIVLTLNAAEAVFAAYIGKGDGSQTVSTAVTVNRKGSSDGMANWSAEQAVFDDFVSNISVIFGALKAETSHPFVAWTWENFSGTSDGLFGAYRPSSARSISQIGV